MSDGEILHSGPYNHLMSSSQEFVELVNAHKETAGTERLAEVKASERISYPAKEIIKADMEKLHRQSEGDQLIKREERETGDSGLKPYLLYLHQNKGHLYISIAAICHLIFAAGQILQNVWMASSVDNPQVSTSKLIVVYLIIGVCSTFFLLIRSLAAVTLGFKASTSLFSQLLASLFRAPISFYDSTPLGRILSRVSEHKVLMIIDKSDVHSYGVTKLVFCTLYLQVSSDLSIVDLDVPFSFLLSMAVTMNTYANLGVLAVITWQVLFVSIPVLYMAIQLQVNNV